MGKKKATNKEIVSAINGMGQFVAQLEERLSAVNFLLKSYITFRKQDKKFKEYINKKAEGARRLQNKERA